MLKNRTCERVRDGGYKNIGRQKQSKNDQSMAKLTRLAPRGSARPDISAIIKLDEVLMQCLCKGTIICTATTLVERSACTQVDHWSVVQELSIRSGPESEPLTSGQSSHRLARTANAPVDTSIIKSFDTAITCDTDHAVGPFRCLPLRI